MNQANIETITQLLKAGNTVPFIARYCKELTNGATDVELRLIERELHHAQDLATRRNKILELLREQEQLTPALESAIAQAQSKHRLEDLYMPYRPNKRQRTPHASSEEGIAAEALALIICTQPMVDIQQYDKHALNAAKQILIERFSLHADLIEALRDRLWQTAKLKVSKGRSNKHLGKYADLLNREEALRSIPAHRALMLLRGRREELLKLDLVLADEHMVMDVMIKHLALPSQPSPVLSETLKMTWKNKLWPKLECEAFGRLREHADEEAIHAFTQTLRDNLLAAAAGKKCVMGILPGLQAGIKLAVIDASGQLLDWSVVHPFMPVNEVEAAMTEIAKLAMRHHVELFALGTGTASRETDQLLTAIMKRYPDLHVAKVVVSDVGVMAYAGSALAAEEFQDLDVGIRAAISIARRLQDPLSELVKIDPNLLSQSASQQDLNPIKLARSLHAAFEDCVSMVTVDVNTADRMLLSYTPGLNAELAKQLVEYRALHGRFVNRMQLKALLGEKAFEQAVGFLRIEGGDMPLDATRIHPAVYDTLMKMLQDHQLDLAQAMTHSESLQSINLNNYVTEQHGLLTLRDVIAEFNQPARDPRPPFKLVNFKSDINNLSALKVGMILEGVVRRLTSFGAFVDIGVNQDGLVHQTEMGKHSHQRLKTGQVIRVKVVEVDQQRRRIGLSMKVETEAKPNRPVMKKPKAEKQPVLFNTAMADALAKLKVKS